MQTYLWRCSRCGATYAPDAVRYTCPRCGETAFLDMLPDYAAIAAAWGREQLAADSRRSIWRYGPLLPLWAATCDPQSAICNLQSAMTAVGWTPLYRAERLGKALGLSQLYIKDDGRNPTGSSKDRASALVV